MTLNFGYAAGVSIYPIYGLSTVESYLCHCMHIYIYRYLQLSYEVLCKSLTSLIKIIKLCGFHKYVCELYTQPS